MGMTELLSSYTVFKDGAFLVSFVMTIINILLVILLSLGYIFKDYAFN